MGATTKTGALGLTLSERPAPGGCKTLQIPAQYQRSNENLLKVKLLRSGEEFYPQIARICRPARVNLPEVIEHKRLSGK